LEAPTTTNKSFLTSSNFSENWKIRTGKGVSVAVIDSGIDSSHPNLKGKIYESVESQRDGKRVIFVPSDSGDSSGHGTACAGIISTIAEDAEIYSVKVLGSESIGDGQTFLAGIEYAIKRKFRIINLSLGTTKPQYFAPLHDLLDRAYQADCIVVAAANNLPQPSLPSIFSSSLISVSKQDEPDPTKFAFRFGEAIELAAYGVNVRTTWLNGGFKRLTGNSFACPHIVGVIAQILEEDPTLKPFQVKSILYEIAKQNSKTE
jgi:subtilisin